MKVHWRKAKVQGGEGFSLAELLLGMKKNLPSSCWGGEVGFFLLENARCTYFFVGVCN